MPPRTPDGCRPVINGWRAPPAAFRHKAEFHGIKSIIGSEFLLATFVIAPASHVQELTDDESVVSSSDYPRTDESSDPGGFHPARETRRHGGQATSGHRWGYADTRPAGRRGGEGTGRVRRVALGSDFRKLWVAYAASEAGTGIGFGAIPLVAILVLDAPAWQVSMLATVAGLAAAAIAVPAGPWVEFRHKRPVMVGADLVRAGALLTVPLALWLGTLSYTQLVIVSAVQTTAAIMFAAAGGAHLKALVPPADRPAAMGRMEATFWTAYSAGPPIGGALTSWVGVSWTIAVDAASFLISAGGVRRIRRPEPDPPVREPSGDRWAELLAGWRHILTHRDLRALFFNAQLFGSGMMAASPLLAVLMLDELSFPAWQYGIAWGLPCLGGVLGALALAPLTKRYGQRRVLLVFGVWRALFLCALAVTPAGLPGLILVVVVELFALFGTGVFNPALAAYRLEQTDDRHLARVISAWGISSRVCQPAGIALGGALAALTDVRTALAACGLAVLASVALLPWRPAPVTTTPAVPPL